MNIGERRIVMVFAILGILLGKRPPQRRHWPENETQVDTRLCLERGSARTGPV